MTQHREVGWAYGIIFDDLGMCGCGDPDGRLEILRDTLRKLDSRETQTPVLEWGPLAEWFLCLLDKAGLTEHGGSIWSSWLEPKGKRFLAVLNDEESWSALLSDDQLVGYCPVKNCPECEVKDPWTNTTPSTSSPLFTTTSKEAGRLGPSAPEWPFLEKLIRNGKTPPK